MNQTGDYLLMQITTKLRSDALSLVLENSNYREASLIKQSELRLHKIFIINENLIESKITSVQSGFMEIVIKKLIELL